MDANFIIANRTDIGAARQANEDSMVTFHSPNGRVVAVCDGMGGQAAGDVASRLACDIIADILENNVFATPREAITGSIMAANQGILHRASQSPELEGMGATCVMVIVKEGMAYYGWVGDSRIYFIHGGNITQISRDQSYVQQLVDSGQISRQEAETHPQKNEITNALGVPGMTPPEMCAAPLRPERGDVILLCSDGLTGMVGDTDINAVVSDSSLTLQERADRLVDMANANGGLDNITVQLIEFDSPVGVGGKAAGKPDARNKVMYYGAAAILAVVAAVAGFLFMGKKEKKEAPRVQDKTEVVDKREKTTGKPAAAPPAPTAPTPAVKTVIVNKETTKKVDKKRENKPRKTGTTVNDAAQGLTGKDPTEPKEPELPLPKPQENVIRDDK